MSSLRSASATSVEEMDVDNPTRIKRTTPEAAQTSQKKTKQDNRNSGSEKHFNKIALPISLFQDPQQTEFWLRFPTMEQIAKNEGREPYTIDTPLEDLIHMGYIPEEAQELLTTKISFPRVVQKLWPTQRQDRVEGQHVNLIQLPFDIDTNQETGLSLDYHILAQFKKSKTYFN